MAIIRKPYRDFKLGAPPPDAKRRVLTQWRGVDLAPVEESRKVRSRSAGDLMPNLLTKLGIDRRRAEAEVLKVWHNLMDPAIVAHAQPTGLHKGTLFVTVDSSVISSIAAEASSARMMPALLISTFSFGYSAISFLAAAAMLLGSSMFSSIDWIPGLDLITSAR